MTIAAGFAFLEASRTKNGVWGYLPNQAAAPEATLLAILAGLEIPHSFLKLENLSWSALLAPFVLTNSLKYTEHPVIEICKKHILKSKSKTYNNVAWFDASIPGWNWVNGTSAWVEPTSYALVSLSALGLQNHKRYIDGQKLLLDRQCQDGGWNYGNPQMLGAVLESTPNPTGWALLAIDNEISAEKALIWMNNELISSRSLSLYILALKRWKKDYGRFQEELLKRQNSDGSWYGRIDLTALALWALK